MFTKTVQREDCLDELMDAFPLASIKDERSYSRAIEILDRLFLLNREMDRNESDYFRTLAQFAYEYESQRCWNIVATPDRPPESMIEVQASAGREVPSIQQVARVFLPSDRSHSLPLPGEAACRASRAARLRPCCGRSGS